MVHEADYRFERFISAEDLYRHSKSVPKGQQTTRLQQIEILLQTLQELGLLRRTKGGCM